MQFHVSLGVASARMAEKASTLKTVIELVMQWLNNWQPYALDRTTNIPKLMCKYFSSFSDLCYSLLLVKKNIMFLAESIFTCKVFISESILNLQCHSKVSFIDRCLN